MHIKMDKYQINEGNLPRKKNINCIVIQPQSPSPAALNQAYM